MTDNTRTGLPELKALSGTGATLFAATGFAAAFGAASCCALPVLLGSLGLGSAWLVSLAFLAGPYRPVLLAAAIVCLVSGRVAAQASPKRLPLCTGGSLRSLSGHEIDYGCPVTRSRPDRARLFVRLTRCCQ